MVYHISGLHLHFEAIQKCEAVFIVLMLASTGYISLHFITLQCVWRFYHYFPLGKILTLGL